MRNWSETLKSSNIEVEEYAAKAVRVLYPAALVCALVSAVVIVAAVVSAPASFRAPLALGATVAAIALCAAVAAAVHYRRAAASAGADAAGRIEAANAAAHGWARESADSEGRRVAAMAAFAVAAGRLQAMTTSMLAELREMEDRHAEPSMLADLFLLDHRTAQAGRLADSLAVLSGGRSGRRWANPISVESILRGAMGRIAGYQRIKLRVVIDVAVAGHAAEGIMHTVAELLDNACNFSPPTTEVQVYTAEIPAGLVITIEDSGLVMSESALRRAELLVSGSDPDDSGSTSDPAPVIGTRLGLAVVGSLARKHGLTVSFRPSAIGGTAAVLLVPRDLTTPVNHAPASIPAASAPESLPSIVPPYSATEDQPDATDSKRRGRTLVGLKPVTEDDVPNHAAPNQPASPPPEWGALQRLVASREKGGAPSPSAREGDYAAPSRVGNGEVSP
ncbi:sensor histidine kinase [Nocardia sp. NPDC049149]|uniref:sensor histidine kinase n=1 Tax=Nocardia sp. NPDC049149 TaxID=3364315 RepID=UPI00371B9A80